MKGNVRVSRPPVVFIGRTGGASHRNLLWHIVRPGGVALCGVTASARQAYPSGLANFYNSMSYRCRTCRSLL